MSKIKVVFLDRDGVINIDKSYVYKIEDFEFCEDIFRLCKHFNKLGYELVIITNQSGINRGYYTQKDFYKLTTWMVNEFKESNIDILDIYHCPHEPKQNCNCRKPKPGMIKKAISKYNIDLENSWFIGDKMTDIKAAINAKIPNHILINSKYTNHDIQEVDLKYRVDKLDEIIKIIKK